MSERNNISPCGKFLYSHDYCMGWFTTQEEKDTTGICSEGCGSDECTKILTLIDIDGNPTNEGRKLVKELN